MLMQQNLVDQWNKSHETIPKDKAPSNYAISIEQEFPESSEVLDIGGGTGADSVYFAEHGHSVTLIDISEYALSRANERAEEFGLQLKQTLQVHLGESPIPLPHNSYDAIYSRLALHYFDLKTTVSVIKDLKSLLKPNGKAYITVKSPNDAKEMDYLNQTAKPLEMGVYEDEGQIKSRFTPEQWDLILHIAGIENGSVKSVVEDLSDKNDVTKSGNKTLEMTEVTFVG